MPGMGKFGVVPAVAALTLLVGCSPMISDSVGSAPQAGQLSTPARPTVQGSWTYQAVAQAGNGNPSFGGDGGAATQAAVWQPRAMISSADGSTYLADTWNNRIRRIDSHGVITTIAGDGSACVASAISQCGDGGPAVKAQLNKPSGLALANKQELIVADTGSNRVRQIDLKTGTITTLAGTGDIGFAGDGAAATQAQLAGPLDVAVDSSGSLLIADTDNNRIRQVDAHGVITTIAGNGSQCLPSDSCGVGGSAAQAQLATPSGIAVDQVGGKDRILIADTNSNTVRSIDSSRIFNTFVGTGSPGSSDDGSAGTQTMLDHPRRVQTGIDGLVVVSDTGNQRLMVSANDGSEVWQTVASKTALNEPWDSITTSSGYLVADAGQNEILNLGNPTGPTLGWGQVCGPDSYAHIGPSGILTDVMTLLPGTTSLDVTGWGAAGGDVASNVHGGAGGYARTLAPASASQYAVIIGCQGKQGFAENVPPGEQAWGSAGGGGATALVSLPGYLAGNANGQVVLVAGGGGGASGYTCNWERSFPVGPGTPCFPGSAADSGAAGGPRAGASGGTAADMKYPTLTGATGGTGTGMGGKLASSWPSITVPADPQTAGGNGFGGSGGDGSSGQTGGWGPQWCRGSTSNCPAGKTPPGQGGNGIKTNFNGGGGGGGAGGGAGGWFPMDSAAMGAGGGGGGGSWAMCADTTKYPDPTTIPAAPISTRAGYLVVTPGSTPAATQCTPLPTH